MNAKTIISNFLYRLEQWSRDNRALLVKAALIIAACLIGALLIYYGVEALARARYERRVQSLEQEIRAAEQKARDAEARAAVLSRAIESKYAELRELTARAEAAESTLRNTKAKVVTLKETYENIRYVPLPAGPVSCEDACRDLATVGYSCR